MQTQAMIQYMKTQAMIATELLKLQNYLTYHLVENAEDINWAHVGDMNHILVHLRQLTDDEE